MRQLSDADIAEAFRQAAEVFPCDVPAHDDLRAVAAHVVAVFRTIPAGLAGVHVSAIDMLDQAAQKATTDGPSAVQDQYPRPSAESIDSDPRSD